MGATSGRVGKRGYHLGVIAISSFAPLRQEPCKTEEFILLVVSIPASIWSCVTSECQTMQGLKHELRKLTINSLAAISSDQPVLWFLSSSNSLLLDISPMPSTNPARTRQYRRHLLHNGVSQLLQPPMSPSPNHLFFYQRLQAPILLCH